jgi:hypothetical protein
MQETPSNFNQFDAAVVGQALGSQPRTMHDVAHGNGEALNVGETTLEVYRDAGVARVTTTDARIELFRVPSYTISGERVVFEQGGQDDRSRLLIRNDGKVSFYPVLRATETSRTPNRAPSGHQDSPTPTDPSGNVIGRNDVMSGSPEGEKGGEVQQVQLRGYVGHNPWYSDRGEQPVAGFSLGVHDERNQTTWHQVVVFDAAAEQLHDAVGKNQIDKGKLVAVTGQPVQREETKPDGRIKKIREFHATAVERVISSKSRPAR